MLARRRQRQSGQRAHLQVELRLVAGIERVVAAVVRARRDFIDHQPAALEHEKLDAQHTHVLQALGNRLRSRHGLLRQRRLDHAGIRLGHGQNAVPVQRNLHREGILAVTEVNPGVIDPALARQAVEATKAIAEGLNYVGVLCVEFFVLEGGQLVVNEMAPRPHNSGHYTLNACDQSQFELQVRTLAGLPLTQPRQHSAAIMLNLLGDLWHPSEELGSDPNSTPDWDKVLALPGTHLHLYGKLSARKGRKMGHLNITAATPEAARAVALQACVLLGMEPF